MTLLKKISFALVATFSVTTCLQATQMTNPDYSDAKDYSDADSDSEIEGMDKKMEELIKKNPSLRKLYDEIKENDEEEIKNVEEFLKLSEKRKKKKLKRAKARYELGVENAKRKMGIGTTGMAMSVGVPLVAKEVVKRQIKKKLIEEGTKQAIEKGTFFTAQAATGANGVTSTATLTNIGMGVSGVGLMLGVAFAGYNAYKIYTDKIENYLSGSDDEN